MGGPDTATSTATGGGGTRLKFHDTELELSALPDVQIEAGAMVLRFNNYSGTITLRPAAAAAAAAAGGEEEDMLLAQLDEELLEAEGGKENTGPVEEEEEQQHRQQQGGGGGGKRGGGAGKKAPAPAAAAAAAVTPKGKGKGKGDKTPATGSGSGSGGKKQPRQQAQQQHQQQQQQQPDGGSARKKPRRGGGGGQEAAVAAGNSNNPLASPAPSTATSHPSSSPAPTTTTTANDTAAAAAPTRGSPPQGRWGHSATVVGDGRMVVYGGEGDDPATGAACTFGDLFVFGLDADGKAGGKWERPLNCDSIPRCWHSATFLPGKNLLVAFGGERMGEGGVPEVLDDIMALDTELFLWYPPAISGKPPTARSGHTASLVGKDIVIFGGSRGRKWCVNTVQCLDVERWSWRSPSIYGNGPPGRSYHSATVVGGHKVVYFGGNDGDRCYNRVHVLQVGGVPGGPKDWEWFHPEVVGRAPTPRTGHAACMLGDGKTILVQGGWDPQDASSDETKVFEDAFLLDTEQWEWTPIPLAQAQQLQAEAEADEQQQAQQQQHAAPAGLLEGGALSPSPGFRVGHTAVLVGAGSKEGGEGRGGQGVQGAKGEGRVLVFGGQDRLGVRREALLVVKG